MNPKPTLYGLILAGGKSTRMGSDKGRLEYHGKPHRQYLYELAEHYCEKVFYSIRKDQGEELDGQPVIVDEDIYRGPLNGILSAHNTYPKMAWLVLACDLPLLNADAIGFLVNARTMGKHATAYATKKTKLPEPLVAIWEPKGMQHAIRYMQAAQSSCARKFLINSDTKLVYPKSDEVLYNANSLDEFKRAKTILS